MRMAAKTDITTRAADGLARPRALQRRGCELSGAHGTRVCPEAIGWGNNVEDQAYLEDLEKRLQKKIQVQAKKRFHLEKFEIQGRDPNSDRKMEEKGAE